jgi:hypothetical protein
MQQHGLIERQAPSQQAQQKDRFAKACPNARHVQGGVGDGSLLPSHVAMSDLSPLTGVKRKLDLGGSQVR